MHFLITAIREPVDPTRAQRLAVFAAAALSGGAA
jgi:hypothetical protein